MMLPTPLLPQPTACPPARLPSACLLNPAGDEYGQTRSGNNNYYGHDTRLTHYDWAALEEAKADGWFRCGGSWGACVGGCLCVAAVEIEAGCCPACPCPQRRALSSPPFLSPQVLLGPHPVPAGAPAAGPRRVPHAAGGREHGATHSGCSLARMSWPLLELPRMHTPCLPAPPDNCPPTLCLARRTCRGTRTGGTTPRAASWPLRCTTAARAAARSTPPSTRTRSRWGGRPSAGASACGWLAVCKLPPIRLPLPPHTCCCLRSLHPLNRSA